MYMCDVHTVYLDWTEENIEQFNSVWAAVLGGEVEEVAVTYLLGGEQLLSDGDLSVLLEWSRAFCVTE